MPQKLKYAYRSEQPIIAFRPKQFLDLMTFLHEHKDDPKAKRVLKTFDDRLDIAEGSEDTSKALDLLHDALGYDA